MHRKADMDLWVGRIDAAEGLAGRRWHQIVAPLEAQTKGVAITGFACDAGVARNLGRLGAKGGPQAIRALLANLPVRRCVDIFDAGDITCPSEDALEQAQAALSTSLASQLRNGLFPLVLGGGHEVAYGSWGGLARYFDEGTDRSVPRIGILNLDAHFDLRLADRASSGTPFRQISEDCAVRGWPFRYCCLGVSEFANTPALFQRAASLGASWLRDEDMGATRMSEILSVLDRFMADLDHLYLTLDLDVLPAGMAPGVSAPSARGVEIGVIETVLDHVLASGKLRLADIAEMNPAFDIDNRTARVAARLAGRIVDGACR